MKHSPPFLSSDILTNLVEVANRRSCTPNALANLQPVLLFLFGNPGNASILAGAISKSIMNWGSSLRGDMQRLLAELQEVVGRMPAAPEGSEEEKDTEALVLPGLASIVHEFDSQSFFNRMLRVASFLKGGDVASFGRNGADSKPLIYVSLDELWDDMSSCLAEVARYDHNQQIITRISPANESFFL